MLRRIRKNKLGFTLVELLVATAILGGLAMLGTKFLWDLLSTRSKQLTIEDSDDNFRFLVSKISKSVQSASNINIPNSTTILISSPIGSPCLTYKLNTTGKSIEQAVDSASPCTPPNPATATFSKISKDSMQIQTLNFTPTGPNVKAVTINISGTVSDKLGSHPISFTTTVTPRVVFTL